MKTKNIVLFFLFALFMLLSFSNKNFSETVICEPDCPETPFITQYPCKVNFQIGTCNFVADFYIRKACGIWCDILLWRVRCVDPPPCNNYDMNQLINIAQAQIIQKIINGDPITDGGLTWDNIVGNGTRCMPDPAVPGGCTTYWRVSKASCWHWFENSGFNPVEPPSDINYWGGISYCTMDVCCLTYYKVCYDDFMQLVVTQVQQTSSGECPYDPSGECQPVCGQ